ncbi:MAG: hypothetical protein HKN19_14625, partial [Halioglobus sp.]|nr:hypothetical protein [Halioglobus sp.]
APWAHMRDRYLDKVTFQNALDLVDEIKPRVLYLALGAPDEDAHRGNYEGYLLSARQMDSYIRRLMEKLEGMPEYAGRTSYIVTVDHGRGLQQDWTSHGRNTPHSDEIWLALLGPDVASHGEITRECNVELGQVASTVAAMLGESYSNEKEVAPPLPYR